MIASPCAKCFWGSQDERIRTSALDFQWGNSHSNHTLKQDEGHNYTIQIKCFSGLEEYE